MLLVIGATNFIGPAVLGRLFEKRDSIKCLIRTDSNIEKLLKLKETINKEKQPRKEIHFVTGTLLSADSTFNCLKEVDSIVYLIDLKNIQLLKNLLLAVSKTPIKRAVFLSSTTVLVPQKNRIKDLKIESEHLIGQSGLDWTLLRPTMIYGTADDRNYSKMLCFIKKKGFFVMFGSGQNLIQPIHVEDVAGAISLVLENKKTYKKIYEICGKNPIKYIDMLDIIKSKTKRQFKIIRLPIKFSKGIISLYSRISPGSSLKPDMIGRMEFDKSYSYEKAARDFKFSPIDFEHGIEKLIKALQI